MDEQFYELVKKVWQVLWGVELTLDIETFKKYYVGDIRLPVKQKSSLSDKETYISKPRKKVMALEEVMQKEKDKGFLVPSEKINSVEELFAKVKDVNYFSGNFLRNSQNVFYSDQVYSSDGVYYSRAIFNSKRVGFSYGIRDSEMVFASEDASQSNYCMRIFESGSLNNCFEAYNCGKSSNSYFIHDSYDLKDCMFCFHLVSKQYCIANMQYDQAEFNRVKKMLVEYINSKYVVDIDM